MEALAGGKAPGDVNPAMNKLKAIQSFRIPFLEWKSDLQNELGPDQCVHITRGRTPSPGLALRGCAFPLIGLLHQ
jgi:hypothetical protein